MRRTAYSVTDLFRLWAGGASYSEIAACLGVTESFIHKLKERHKLPNRPRQYAAPTNDPTPDEIEERKAEVRAAHFAKRRGETEDQTRCRVWQEDQAWLRRLSQSQA
jgi:hypothetical protein